MKRLLTALFVLLGTATFCSADLIRGTVGSSSGSGGSSNLPASVVYTTSTVPFTVTQTVNSSATINGNLGIQGQINGPLTVSSSSTLQGVVGLPGNINTQITAGSSITVQGNIGIQGAINQPLTATSSVTVSNALAAGTQSSTASITGNLSTLGGVYFSSLTANGTTGKISANYTTGVTDHIIYASAPAAGLTVTLNSSAGSIIGGSNQVIQITKVDGSTYSVTVKTSGTDLIDGTTGLLKLNAIGQTAELVSDGNGNWWPHGQGIQITPNLIGPGATGNSLSTINVASQPVCESFYVNVPVAVDSVTVYVGVADPLMDVGIYDTAGNRLASAGAVTPVAGRFNAPLTSVVNLSPGIYWECLVSANAVSTFESLTYPTNIQPGQQSCTAAAGNVPLPATLPFPCTASRLVQYSMWAHIAGGTL